MLKNILNLEGAQQLSNNEQKDVTGGLRQPIICGGEGFLSSLNSCLCNNGGTFNTITMTCSNGLANNTNNLYENATGCCYSN